LLYNEFGCESASIAAVWVFISARPQAPLEHDSNIVLTTVNLRIKL